MHHEFFVPDQNLWWQCWWQRQSHHLRHLLELQMSYKFRAVLASFQKDLKTTFFPSFLLPFCQTMGSFKICIAIFSNVRLLRCGWNKNRKNHSCEKKCFPYSESFFLLLRRRILSIASSVNHWQKLCKRRKRERFSLSKKHCLKITLKSLILRAKFVFEILLRRILLRKKILKNSLNFVYIQATKCKTPFILTIFSQKKKISNSTSNEKIREILFTFKLPSVKLISF